MISLKPIFLAVTALLMVACSADKSPVSGQASASAETNTSHNVDALLKSCASCHGDKGQSNAAAWPNLAGQKAGYLALQMQAFKDGSRQDTMMATQARSLSEQDIEALAVYYSQQLDHRVKTAEPNMAGANVRARCVSCHGREGRTVNRTWPNLAGQQKDYLAKQLLDYKSGQRKHPIMEVIANELNQQQINDVAEYYSQIPAS